MIPKSAVEKSEPMLTVEKAEERIDGALRSDPPAYAVNLHPIHPNTLAAVVGRYKDGGWKVEVSNLRMPNGYQVKLS